MWHCMYFSNYKSAKVHYGVMYHTLHHCFFHLLYHTIAGGADHSQPTFMFGLVEILSFLWINTHYYGKQTTGKYSTRSAAWWPGLLTNIKVLLGCQPYLPAIMLYRGLGYIFTLQQTITCMSFFHQRADIIINECSNTCMHAGL